MDSIGIRAPDSDLTVRIDKEKLKASSDFFVAQLSGTWQIPDPIEFPGHPRHVLQALESFLKDGKYTNNTEAQLKATELPFEPFCEDVAVYKFADMYLFKDLAAYALKNVLLRIAAVWRGMQSEQYSLITAREMIVLDIYNCIFGPEKACLKPLNWLAVKTARLLGEENMSPLTKATLFSSPQFYVAWNAENRNYRRIFQPDPAQRTVVIEEWFRDEYFFRENALSPVNAMQLFLHTIRRLYTDGESYSARACVSAIWGMGIPGTIFRDYADQAKETVAAQLPLPEQHRSRRLARSSCIQFMNRLSRPLIIPSNIDIYSCEMEFLAYSSLEDITRVAGLRPSANSDAAAYMKFMAPTQFLTLDFYQTFNVNTLRDFIRGTQLLEDGAVDELQTLAECQEIAMRPVRAIWDFLNQDWKKMADFYRLASLKFLCLPDSQDPALDAPSEHGPHWLKLSRYLFTCENEGVYTAPHQAGKQDPQSEYEFALMLRGQNNLT
ncbi:hypothetical protein BJY04DRAFT_222759 [Aspergillus karnatakaensis]|uniref:uncharacterized protein n=1 Tax=Aspergillus karnatakaensis TaxID=1810916 RepID=UPI003CCD3B76